MGEKGEIGFPELLDRPLYWGFFLVALESLNEGLLEGLLEDTGLEDKEDTGLEDKEVRLETEVEREDLGRV